MHGLFKVFSWTDEKIAELRALNAQGIGPTQIAGILDPSGYLTRNAVIGKRSRLGLSVPRVKGQPKVERKPAATNIPQFEGGEPVDIPPDSSPHAVSLFNVREDQCRWPIDDPKRGFLFCGATQAEGSYCRRHHEIGHGKGTWSERNAGRGL